MQLAGLLTYSVELW